MCSRRGHVSLPARPKSTSGKWRSPRPASPPPDPTPPRSNTGRRLPGAAIAVRLGSWTPPVADSPFGLRASRDRARTERRPWLRPARTQHEEGPTTRRARRGRLRPVRCRHERPRDATASLPRLRRAAPPTIKSRSRSRARPSYQALPYQALPEARLDLESARPPLVARRALTSVQGGGRPTCTPAAPQRPLPRSGEPRRECRLGTPAELALRALGVQDAVLDVAHPLGEKRGFCSTPAASRQQRCRSRTLVASPVATL